MHQCKVVPNIKYLSSISGSFNVALWDMDGTIMQTECLHTIATQTILKNSHPKMALSYSEIEEKCIGETDQTILESLQSLNYLTNLTLSQFIMKKNQIISEKLISMSDEEIFRPEVRALMEELKSSGIKQAVVTSSEKDITHTLLKHLNLQDYFSLILTREDTRENKPSPMPYLTAMERLSATPENTLIFEDSTPGLAAANASQATTIQACWY